jgi:myo-inositol 2-dehydrogenase/D-chiro-inositol 1-dehydrogenase
MGDTYPVKCCGTGGRQARTGAEYGHIFDHHAVVYEYASGAKCFACCRQQVGCANQVTDFVFGTKGTAAIVLNQRQHKIMNLQGTDTWRYQGDLGNMYQNEHNELFASIRSGQPINNGNYMTKSTLMGVMGRMATYTGREITWEQALNSREDLAPPRYEWGPLAVAAVARPGITPFS